MGQRLDLHAKLKTIVDNVYFQAPPSNGMSYPCILYNLDDVATNHANNVKYKKDRAYQLTLMDRDPDTELVDDVLDLERCRFVRSFKKDGLHQFVFTLYF